jgi:hypothetical protein
VIAAVRTPAETVSYSLTPLALYTLLALSLDRLGTAWSNVRTPADLASLPSVVEALAIPASVEIDPADRARIGRLAAALLGVLRGRVVLSPALAQGLADVCWAESKRAAAQADAILAARGAS